MGNDILWMRVKKGMIKGIPDFYKEVLDAWKDFLPHIDFKPQGRETILNQPLFLNAKIAIEGKEYFRVTHDRQVHVCRLCIKTGHLIRECPEFKCFTCGKVGHYARECGERTARVTEEEGEQSEDDERREEDQAEKQSTENKDDMAVTKDGGESGDGQDGAGRGQRAGTAGEEADDGEGIEEKEEEEEDVKVVGTKKEKKVVQLAIPPK